MNDTPYSDIIHLTRPVSKRHPKMSLQDRAAQFSPFAALTGFEEGIRETARKTTRKKELDESEKNLINEKLNQLVNLLNASQTPSITLEYFVEDTLKEGGAYCTKTGQVRKMDIYRNLLVFTDNTTVNIEDIIGLELHG